jgi:hypothetical protein
VQDLRAEGMTGQSLSDRLAQFGEELKDDRSVEFTLLVIGSPQTLDPIVCSVVWLKRLILKS